MLFREFEPPDQKELAWRPNLRMLYEAAPGPERNISTLLSNP